MDTEQYYLLKIEGLQEKLKEIDLELDAIIELFSGEISRDYTVFTLPVYEIKDSTQSYKRSDKRT